MVKIHHAVESILIGGIATLVCVLPLDARANLFDDKIIKVVTASDPGTAFVIGPSERGTCVLLTAYHVIKDNSPSEPLQFITPRGQKFSASKAAFSFDEALDIAFIPASSCADSIGLPLARASTITVSTKVHIKGYPVDQEAVHSKVVAPFTVSGRITQYNDSSRYDLSYDAPTQPGYSGGPVLNDDAAELMAIHGFSDTIGETTDYDLREKLRVGGRGVSAPLIYKFLKSHGIMMPRSEKAICLVGVC